MARLREKIKELQTQYGITEDAAKAVLALHEGDLSEASAMVATEQEKVVKWNQWYADNAPVIQASLTELEQLRQKVNILEKNGITVQPVAPQTPQTPANTPAFNAEDLKSEIYRNFSAVQKDLYNIQRQHMQNYKELPDIEPIEKLIETKKLSPWQAYQEWVAPMENERKEKELREKITAELTTKFQNENTRSGVNGFLLQNKSSLTGEEVTSPLDEVARDQAQKAAATPKQGEAASGPSELELMADFIGTMQKGRASQAH